MQNLCACWTAGCLHSWGIPVSDPSYPTPGVTRNALACHLWKSIDVPKRMGAINYILDWFMTELSEFMSGGTENMVNI